MKDLLIDLCLVGLFLFLVNATLNDYQIEKTIFQNNMTKFEETIDNQEPIDSSVGMIVDYEDNAFSLFVKGISSFCIETIKIIVLIISNFISMLL